MSALKAGFTGSCVEPVSFCVRAKQVYLEAPAIAGRRCGL